MNSFEMNKIIGAILGTLVLVMGIGFLADAIYAPIEGRGPGYNLPLPESAGEGGDEVEAEPEMVPISVLLASASADAGSGVARKCAACHTFEEGGANKVGPALYGIVGATIGGVEGFAYSDVLSQLGAEGGTWSYESLNAFLTSPKEFAPGTKMSFAGLRKEGDRADLLAYMQTMAGTPVPFPAAEAAMSEAAPKTEAMSEAAPETAPQATTEQDAAVQDTTSEAAPETPVEEAAGTATEMASEATTAVTDSASEAASEATSTVTDMATEVTSGASDAASEAVTAVTDSASETASEAASAVTEATTATTEAASEAAVIVEEAAPADQNSALFALLNSASAEDGARVSRKCAACHSFDEGGANKVGPALYDIVGAQIAANETFRYSDTFKALGAEGKTWDFEELDAFLTKPREYAPGTKMAFGGLSKPEDRAALIVYMTGMSASPVPLP